jgi:hypothetical protein
MDSHGLRDNCLNHMAFLLDFLSGFRHLFSSAF